MIHMDCQSVWFNAIKNEGIWNEVLKAGTHNGMEECRLITMEGKDRLAMQQGGEGGVNGVWCHGTTGKGRKRQWRG